MGAIQSITERFVAFIATTKKSIRRASIEMGMNQRTLDRIVKQENKLSVDALSSILTAYPELSSEWLMRGKGDMLIPQSSEEELQALNSVIADLTETLKNKNKEIALLQKRIEELTH